MRTYDPKKRHGCPGRYFTGNGCERGDVIDLLCGEGMENEAWFKQTEKYVRSLQNEDGSFRSAPRSDQKTIRTACYAILSLKAIGCKDAEVFAKAKEYIMSLRNEEDGSFGWSDVDRTGYSSNGFYAITALRAMRCADWEVLRQCKECMESMENLDGGFGSSAGVSSDIKKTGMALLTLKAAGTPKKDMPASKNYVMPLKGRFGDVIDTSHAVLALHALGCEVPEEPKEYLRRSVDGGGIDVSTLYHAVLGLFAAGERDLPVKYADYARKLKNVAGGFGRSVSEWESDVDNTFYAIMTIKAVKRSRGK